MNSNTCAAHHPDGRLAADLMPNEHVSADRGATARRTGDQEGRPDRLRSLRRAEHFALGAGGFGAVDLGRDTPLDRPVAIKPLQSRLPVQQTESNSPGSLGPRDFACLQFPAFPDSG
jgi:hypothetical protein